MGNERAREGMRKGTLAACLALTVFVIAGREANASVSGASPLCLWGALAAGELKKWHKVTLTFDGPSTSETSSPNPFRDYRLDVTFSHPGSGKSYLVPGYYAADGNAAETSAASGGKWRAHFAPDETGLWSYSASFRTGTDVAAADDPGSFPGAGHFDGATGSFSVAATDKTGRDFRGKGRLQYVGKHHLRFAETGEYFLKCGADAPENFLAYADFDGDFKTDGQKDSLVKTWNAHTQDWRTGDPSWQGGKGKGIVGAVNYLASEGMNAFSFLTLNIAGDDRNVFPYTSYDERYRFDCSRLDQWEIVFEHADRMGMYLHFKTQETENETLLDGGDVGTQRKLYYRELIARFGHHLALNWNLGEENGALGTVNQTTAQRKAMAQYFYDNDPYRHHIVIHNGKMPDDLLGNQSKLTGFSLQTSQSDFSRVHNEVLSWVNKSAAAGRPWVVACDEPGDASHALVPDSDDPMHDNARKNGLWGAIMAGGGGLEWYFGYLHDHSDLTCEDFRSRDLFWDQCRHALEFFENKGIPFWDMHSDDGLTSATSDYCFAKPGAVYVVYLKSGGTTDLDLSGAAYDFTVKWYNPRAGGALTDGGVVTGGGTVAVGPPPTDTGKDWVALVEPAGSVTTYALTVVDGRGGGDYPEGAKVQITADAKAGKMFDHWSGDTQHLASATSSPTTVTMPASDVSVAANYVEAPPGDTVISFTLIDADTDAPIPLYDPLISLNGDGATLNLTTLPTRNLNIRANTSPATVGSVRFGFDGNDDYRTENAAPYALAGDTGGDYNAWTPGVGGHTLTATPYSESDGGGTAGTPLSISFSVVDQPPVDTDGDGMWDGDERACGLDPQDGDQDGNGVLDGDDDWNGNGIDNKTELAGWNDPGDPPARPSGGGCAASCPGAVGTTTLSARPGVGGRLRPQDLPGPLALLVLPVLLARPWRRRTRAITVCMGVSAGVAGSQGPRDRQAAGLRQPTPPKQPWLRRPGGFVRPGPP